MSCETRSIIDFTVILDGNVYTFMKKKFNLLNYSTMFYMCLINTKISLKMIYGRSKRVGVLMDCM